MSDIPSTPMDLRVLTSFMNQLFVPLDKLMDFNQMNWQQLQTSYQIIIERYQRLLSSLNESHDQTLLFPFKPTGTKLMYPNVYLRSKSEPFIEDYLNQLQGIDYEYDAEIEAALLLFEEQ